MHDPGPDEPGCDRQRNEWRKRQIVMDPELVRRVDHWHSGQFSRSYALASTGARDLVSLSMVDAALFELRQERERFRTRLKAGQLRDLGKTIDALAYLRTYWAERSAAAAGMDVEEYAYDETDYGTFAEDEAAADVRSG